MTDKKRDQPESTYNTIRAGVNALADAAKGALNPKDPPRERPPADEVRKPSGLFMHEYVRALRKNYKQLADDPEELRRYSRTGVEYSLHQFENTEFEKPKRFQKLSDRPWTVALYPWVGADKDNPIRIAYKGLFNGKTAFDLVLYSNLIWELQPKTILEFGAMQGGSALWFADQLDVLCQHGEVHSYERMIECVSPRAKHPRLTFHQADLNDLSSVDPALLERLPHPWLVVDDAHANVAGLLMHLNKHMKSGDYYIVEDVLVSPTQQTIVGASQLMNQVGFLVDTVYTDAFGVNVTSAPNGWFRKS